MKHSKKTKTRASVSLQPSGRASFFLGGNATNSSVGHKGALLPTWPLFFQIMQTSATTDKRDENRRQKLQSETPRFQFQLQRKSRGQFLIFLH